MTAPGRTATVDLKTNEGPVYTRKPPVENPAL